MSRNLKCYVVELRNIQKFVSQKHEFLCPCNFHWVIQKIQILSSINFHLLFNGWFRRQHSQSQMTTRKPTDFLEKTSDDFITIKFVIVDLVWLIVNSRLSRLKMVNSLFAKPLSRMWDLSKCLFIAKKLYVFLFLIVGSKESCLVCGIQPLIQRRKKLSASCDSFTRVTLTSCACTVSRLGAIVRTTGRYRCAIGAPFCERSPVHFFGIDVVFSVQGGIWVAERNTARAHKACTRCDQTNAQSALFVWPAPLQTSVNHFIVRGCLF